MSSIPPGDLEEEMVGDDSMEEDTPNILHNRFPRTEHIIELWNQKTAERVLSTAHFQEHWRVTVPNIYSPQPNRTCLDYAPDEDMANLVLIQPLELFIWGSSYGKPPPRRSTLCGKVFKQGEPAYSCRECGMDNTCVLCVECFKVSTHRHHKYKMGQSGGGGCCDCGDTEAWKRDPFCELHAAPSGDAQAENTVSPEVIERMKLVTSACLSYCFRLLTLDHAPELPSDLRLRDTERDLLQILDQPDCYCTVLYNDELHTFEQVISTLSRVMKYKHRDAVELVSLIDREGRALVNCNSFQVCGKLKADIEMFTVRHGATLKVLVMHAHVIAHQTFAMRLLTWLQNFVSQEPTLRLAVSQVLLGEDVGNASATALVGGGIAGGVMQNDCRMWKAARTAWHRLLIATTLMDYSTKKAMAVLFTKNYGSILKDFIRDDHDHSFSISSLSVQLYTTPTLAHHLIAKHDALFVLLNTFVSECKTRCNSKGRLEFDRHISNSALKRAQFILFDVKYLLGTIPSSFDDDLRKGLLHGLSLLLNLLLMMQGMDSVVRQVGQHMEYEPEWETAFNLHVKLAHSITLCLEWCSAERSLLAAAYRMALRRLREAQQAPNQTVVELGNKSARVIQYNVSSEPVSIHQPLTRFLAGLHLRLYNHDLSYHSREFDTPEAKPTPEDLIEPILRTKTMIAQVHAGMWRRNGFALLNQLYFYHNVKCRAEMLDRDVVMLQIGASLIESNEFLIHVLNKFKLLGWASPDFEPLPADAPDDMLRHTISMVEEFLGLLITIVGSRHVPGIGEVTNEDRTKKEIIQMLCVKPMPHSELNRSLPEDQLHETGLESVINEVAEFTKPTSGTNRGVYKLKPELYDEYDTFFYHYTREELSRSEEEQRNRRKSAGLPECCPPPQLPRLTPPFRLVANLLQCDVAIYVLLTVLNRALDLRARSFSESCVHKALHLIGYALRDEESGHYEFLAFAETAERRGLLDAVQLLTTSPRVDAHSALARWVLAKMRQLLGQNEEQENSDKMETVPQEKQPADGNDAEKARRAKLAAERRAKLMAQMKTQMNNFISNNATLFEETNTEVTSEEQELAPLYSGAALGTWGGGVPDPPRVCIMCQEEARVDLKADTLVLVAFVQQSTVLNRWRGSGVEPKPTPASRAWLPHGIGSQAHVSLCGHALHATCWRKYVDTVLDKENRRPYRLRQPAAFDIEKKEYLCPLCERLCNTALPLVPAAPLPGGIPPPLSEQAFEETVSVILTNQVTLDTVHECTESCEEMHCQARARSVGAASDTDEGEAGEESSKLLSSTGAHLLPAEAHPHFRSIVPDYGATTGKLLHQLLKILPGICGESETGGLASLAAFYRATSYTILSTNAVLLAEKRPLLGELPARHKDALQALIRVASIVPSAWHSPKQLAHHALTTLSTLELTSPLLHETFSTMVTLVLTAPSMFSDTAGPARPNNLAKQITLRCLRAHITKALIIIDVRSYTSEPMEVQDDCGPQSNDLDNLLPIMKELRRGRLDIENLNAAEIWRAVKSQCNEFLRCSCLFFHFLSDIIPPTELTVFDGDTFEVMCGYLDMPTTFKALIDNGAIREKAMQWSLQSTEWFKGELPRSVLLEPSGPPRLVLLPDDFSELMNVVSEFSCPNSDREDSKFPTMCLVCEKILCSQSYCCQTEFNKSGRGGPVHVGAVVGHAVSCGGGAGLFLRVRDCEVLLLAAPARGAMQPAPYLDSYGEPDQGLRRGNPLHLCPEWYEKLRMLWLSHGLHEKIARSLDTNMLITTQWQNM